jgi:hypothetical protein
MSLTHGTKLALFAGMLYSCSVSEVNKGKIYTYEADFDNWENCETGEGECKPVIMDRASSADGLILQMPCGGTQTTVTLYADPALKKMLMNVSVMHDECPPVFDMTGLSDGKYYAHMMSCGLGGALEIQIITLESSWK